VVLGVEAASQHRQLLAREWRQQRHPTFTIDVPGTYVVSLKVTDVPGTADNGADQRSGHGGDLHKPRRRGPVQRAAVRSAVGSTVALDATASHEPGWRPIVSYAWTVDPHRTRTVQTPEWRDHELPWQPRRATIRSELVVSDFELASAPASAIHRRGGGGSTCRRAVADFDTVMWYRSNQPPTSVTIDVLANDTDTDALRASTPPR